MMEAVSFSKKICMLKICILPFDAFLAEVLNSMIYKYK